MNNFNDIMPFVYRDNTLKHLTPHDLKVMRANMIMLGNYTKYQFALVQYWIMKKENRLPSEIGSY